MNSPDPRFERVFGLYFAGSPLSRRAYGVLSLTIALAGATLAWVVVTNTKGPFAAAVFGVGGITLMAVHLLIWRDVMVRTYRWLLGKKWGDRTRMAAWFIVLWSILALTLGFYGLLIVIGQA